MVVIVMEMLQNGSAGAAAPGEMNHTTDGFLSSILNDEDLQLMDMAMNEGTVLSTSVLVDKLCSVFHSPPREPYQNIWI